jgi:hypothetical protein
VNDGVNDGVRCGVKEVVKEVVKEGIDQGSATFGSVEGAGRSGREGVCLGGRERLAQSGHALSVLRLPRRRLPRHGCERIARLGVLSRGTTQLAIGTRVCRGRREACLARRFACRLPNVHRQQPLQLRLPDNDRRPGTVSTPTEEEW